MKKTYLQPWAIVAEIGHSTMICNSDIKSNNGIDYGGVDETGGKEPASRRKSVWDEEEEEER